MPCASSCALQTTKKECKQHLGLNFEIFQYFSKLLGLPLNVIQAEDNAYKYQDDNGSWHGLLGMLVRNEIDAGGTLLYQESPSELGLADYSLPIGLTFGGFVFKSRLTEPKSDKIFGIFMSFRWEVWLCILASLTFVYSTQILIATTFRLNGIYEHTFGSSILNAVVMVNSIFISIQYQSDLIRQYTIKPKELYPFSNFEELATVLETKEFSMVTHKYSRSFLHTVNTSDDANFVRIRESFKTNPLVLIKDRRKGICFKSH